MSETTDRRCEFCGEGDYPREGGPPEERVCATWDYDGKPYHPSCLAQKVNYRGKTRLSVVPAEGAQS